MNYTYSVLVDFTSTTTPSAGALTSEIMLLGLGASLSGVSTKGDVVTISFDGSVTGMDKTKLDQAVSDHTGIVSVKTVIETVMIVPTDRRIDTENDWQDLGGVIVAPASFPVALGNLRAQVTGQFKIKAGMDAELCLTESGDWNSLPDSELIDPPHVLTNSNDGWLPFTIVSNIDVRDGYWAYVVKARAGGCDGFYLRYLTLSIVEQT